MAAQVDSKPKWPDLERLSEAVAADLAYNAIQRNNTAREKLRRDLILAELEEELNKNIGQKAGKDINNNERNSSTL